MVELDSSIYLFLCTQCRAVGKGDTGKQKRRSIESADMEKIEHDIQSKPTEATCRRQADGYEHRIMLH